MDEKNILSVTEAKSGFGNTIERVMLGERLILARHGRPKVAMISYKDLLLLQELEDFLDREEMKKVLAEEDPGRFETLEELFGDRSR